MMWTEPTAKLRWVEKDIPRAGDDNGQPSELQRQKVLQQWHANRAVNFTAAANYTPGEWRDVPIETEE